MPLVLFGMGSHQKRSLTVGIHRNCLTLLSVNKHIC